LPSHLHQRGANDPLAHPDAVRRAVEADSDRHSVATFGVQPNTVSPDENAQSGVLA
jgi:hypothetical protein